MQNLRHVLLIFLFILSLITACKSADEPTGVVKTPVVTPTTHSTVSSTSIAYSGKQADQQQVDALAAKAQLRERLPENTVAYVRVPNYWGFFFTPKNTVLDKALRDLAHVQEIIKLREAWYKSAILPDPGSYKHSLALVTYHMRAPLELALVEHIPDQTKSYAIGIAATKLDFKSVNEFKSFLAGLVKEHKELSVVSETSASGEGELKIINVSAWYRFDVASGLFTLVSGEGLSKSQADVFLATKAATASPMHEIEKTIDASHQGFFFWANPPRVAAVLKMGGAAMAGTGTLKFVAMGWGVAEGKGRLRMSAQTAMDLGSYFTGFGDKIELKAAGEPGIVIGIALPGPQQWQAIKVLVQGAPGFNEAMVTMKTKAGFDIDELVNAIGSQLIVGHDQSGWTVSVQIRNKQAFDALMQNAIKTTKAPTKKITVANQDIHYAKFSLGFDVPAGLDPTLQHWMKVYLRQKMHLYWVEEQNYMVIASVPQILTDRIQAPNRVSIGEWLAKTQKQNVSKASVFLSTQIDGTPRELYNIYLGFLHFLADISDTDVNLAALPSAQQLGLPRTGTYGFQFDVSNYHWNSEFTFENNPFEFFVSGGGVGTVAAIGIVAAIAIPAYTDYQKRALRIP